MSASAFASVLQNNEEIDDSTLAFPILSWNSSDPDLKPNFTPEAQPSKKEINTNNSLNFNYPSPYDNTGSTYGSTYVPIEIQQPVKKQPEIQKEDYENIPISYNYYTTNYSSV